MVFVLAVAVSRVHRAGLALLLTFCTEACSSLECCDSTTNCCNDRKGGCKNSGFKSFIIDTHKGHHPRLSYWIQLCNHTECRLLSLTESSLVEVVVRTMIQQNRTDKL